MRPELRRTGKPPDGAEGHRTSETIARVLALFASVDYTWALLGSCAAAFKEVRFTPELLEIVLSN